MQGKLTNGLFTLGRVWCVRGALSSLKIHFPSSKNPAAHSITAEPHNKARTDRDWTQKVIQHIAAAGHFYSNKRRRRGWKKMAAAGRLWQLGVRRLRQLLQHMTRVCHTESEVRAPINNGRSFNDKVLVRAVPSKCRFQSTEHRYIFIFSPFVCLFCKWCRATAASLRMRIAWIECESMSDWLCVARRKKCFAVWWPRSRGFDVHLFYHRAPKG